LFSFGRAIIAGVGQGRLRTATRAEREFNPLRRLAAAVVHRALQDLNWKLYAAKADAWLWTPEAEGLFAALEIDYEAALEAITSPTRRERRRRGT